ncbi:ABC transporter substrate-binding protein [Peribacillus frigoritolerans]|uniref:ABC transporter substrate-binding protein n=1 Tax=Peribacillus frigoritolerans TaxID=450367 RepID=UPI0007BFE5FC|nr:ABC transporter substrate-binding protein [Peribacillus frigoritolerans]MCT4477093.1 ABC transporter substrate-binding protein [Peribacillus frigoritolerans]MED4690402.1 ABC transporter substrate-binding protein [Peribacillus frigoritolerans]
MKKLSKKLLVLLLASIMIFATGCSSKSNADGDKKAKTIKIGMSFQEMNNPYFISMKEAFEDAAKDIGAEVVIADAQHDVSKQINDIDDMIQKKIDILLINPTDSKGAEAAVEAAKKAGVIVVAVDAQAEGPLDSFVGSKNYDAGYLAGKKMAEDLGGKGKVAILDGIPVVPILERVKGFKAAIAENPGIEIVNTQNGKQDRAEAMKVTENMLQANPDLNALFSVNDEGALGSLGAIEASGKDVSIYSVDGHPEAIEAIVKGGVFKATTAQFPRDQVRIALGMALAKLWGAEVVPTEVPIDVKLQTKENAKDFSW